MKEQSDASVDFMDAFCASMDTNFAPSLKGVRAIAVGISGGADSFALCFALSEYFSGKDVVIYAITVDHNLRAESAQEAKHVSKVLDRLANVEHVTLNWEHEERPSARIQEEARHARYDLMRGFMADRSVTQLFLGHHMDDQAETFLFRLAKGSGLDGLACMPFMQDMAGVYFCRPMLPLSKQDAIDFCRARGVEYIDDPSNDDDKYARVRLRQSMDVLAQEGLTPERLSQVAMRMSRARLALDRIAEESYKKALFLINSKRIVFNFNLLILNDEELFYRVVEKAVSELREKKQYGVRMKKLERLCRDLKGDELFRKQTLGGVVFEVDQGRNELILTKEE